MDSSSPIRLETDHLSIHFGDRSALTDVSCCFRTGESVSLIGPNGAGKSTLLRALAGMLPPSHGVVRFDGKPITRPSPAIVYVPQRTGVDWTFPLCVMDVALMGIGLSRSRFRPISAKDHAAARHALSQVGMDHLANAQIGKLSGGQQQRVFLARALIQDGEVYLLDEPFTGVDIPTQELLIELFDRLRAAGKTIVYATHDLGHVAATSDRVMLLNRRLIAVGPPALTMNRDNLIATFGGQAIVPVMESLAR
jgi:manganese/zinc/iron transport system ATP- binding protein